MVWPRLKRVVALSLYYGLARHLPSRGPLREPGRWIRQELCRRFLDGCGDWVGIGSNVHLSTGRDVYIGNRSGLNDRCRIYGGVIIGEKVMVGPDVTFLSENHRFDDPDRPIGEQGFTERTPPRVDNDAWIGLHATILPGRVIGRGSVVGACAVVTHDVPPYAIVAGNPARVIGTRLRSAPSEIHVVATSGHTD